MGFWNTPKMVPSKCPRPKCGQPVMKQEDGPAVFCSDGCKTLLLAYGYTICPHCEGPITPLPGLEIWKNGPLKKTTGLPAYRYREGVRFWQKAGCVAFCSQACHEQRLVPDPPEWDTPEYVAEQDKRHAAILAEMERDPEAYAKKMAQLARMSHRSQVMGYTRDSQDKLLEVTQLRKEARQHLQDAEYAKKMGQADQERAHRASHEHKTQRATSLEKEVEMETEATQATTQMMEAHKSQPLL